MSWTLRCTRRACARETEVANIADLIRRHTDSQGWFRCPSGHPAYVAKSYGLQEAGRRWRPYLRGAVSLKVGRRTYHPFVFLVSYRPAGRVNDLWFSYYKDLRRSGGRLKLGYGPGGPPVLSTEQLMKLLRHLTAIRCLSARQIRALATGRGAA